MRVLGTESQSWDVFCRVIDNHGDLGVCWRLARGLAQADQRVRLWVDDPGALSWMAPELTLVPLTHAHAPGEPGALHVHRFDDAAGALPSDVVIETFGCDPPPAYVARMPRPPSVPSVWINLEYLSAERYVERSHGLPSPQLSGPGLGLSKWFFYPGLTSKTGGTLERTHSMAEQPDLPTERSDWLKRWGVQVRPHTRWVSLFCYQQPTLPFLLDSLADDATWPAVELLIAPGWPLDEVNGWLAQRALPRLCTPIIRQIGKHVDIGRTRLHALPYLPQTVHDGFLHRCDLNLVRGEDSWVTGLHSGRPMLWQAYPQDGQVHAAKLAAFLDLYLANAPAELRAASATAHRLWNGLALPDSPDVLRKSLGESLRSLLADSAREHARQFAQQLGLQPDLLTQLRHFVNDRRAPGVGSATG